MARFVVILIVLAGPLLAQRSSRNESGCVVCHGKEGLELQKSVHAEGQITCVACHGGVADSMDKDVAHGPELQGLSDPKTAVDGCSACHADFTRMRAFGLSASQTELYWTSEHGRRLAEEGDPNVATCVSCHGSHAVFRSSDSRSPIHKRNQLETCSECHADAALMERYELSADVHDVYRDSVHGRALLERNLLSSPACSDCHGSHGAAPPDVSEVGQVCGNCHTTVKEFFNESPHREPALEGAMTECISCHGHHGVANADEDLLVGTGPGHCSTCHRDANEPARQVAARLYDYLDSLDDRIEEAQEAIRTAGAGGLFIEREHGYIEDAQALRARGGSMVHTLSPSLMSEVSNRGNAMIEQTYESLGIKERMLRDRKIFTGIFLGVVLLLAAMLQTYRRAAFGGWKRPDGSLLVGRHRPRPEELD